MDETIGLDQFERLKRLGLHATLGDFINGRWLVVDQYQTVSGFRGFGDTLEEAIDDWCDKHPEYRED